MPKSNSQEEVSKQAVVSISAGLSGKAKEAFEDWLFTTRNEEIIDGEAKYDLYYMFMYMLPETCKNALIIEWFDSEEIYCYFDCQWSSIYNIWWRFHLSGKRIKENIVVSDFKNRQDAINASIEKAVEIYNTESGY